MARGTTEVLDVLIGVASMVCSSHEDNVFLFINFKKEAPRTNPVSPCFRLKILEFFDIRPEVRVFA